MDIGLVVPVCQLSWMFLITLCTYIVTHLSTWCYLILALRQQCPPLFVVDGLQAVVESRSSREIDNIPKIKVQFTLKAKNRTRENM